MSTLFAYLGPKEEDKGSVIDGESLEVLQNRAVLQMCVLNILTENQSGLSAREIQMRLGVQRKRLFDILKYLRLDGKVRKFSEKRTAKDGAQRIQTIFALNQP